MTEINNLTVYMSFTGATPAAVKGEVEEYIREELTDSLADGSVLTAKVTISNKSEHSSLYVELKGATYQEERIAFMAWLAESKLWKTCALNAIAMHSNEFFDLIAETYQINGMSNQLVVSYMKDNLLDLAVKESLDYESMEAKQASADMAWHILQKAGKLESLVVPLRRRHAS